MKRKMKLTAFFMAIVMVIALNCGVLAQEVDQAQTEQEQTQAGLEQTQEVPAAWASEGVSWSAIYGLVSQDMLANYRADVTRAELYSAACSLYIRLTGKTIEPKEDDPFADAGLPVASEAYAIGIIDGGSFEPEEAATRQEMADVIFKVLDVSGLELDLSTAGSNTHDAVQFFCGNGLLKGRGGNELYLASPCSRQELMVFLHRVYEYTAYETGNYSKGLFWKASDEDSTIYLLGSIHLADQSLYPLSKDILNAFDSSDVLVLEADLSNIEEGTLYMQQKMFYEGDETIDKNIPEGLYEVYSGLMDQLGVNPDLYNKFKPWYAAMLIQNLALGNTGEAGAGSADSANTYSSALGIDMYFTAKAIGSKEIAEIEGLKFQVDMFDSFSDEIQAWYLASVLLPSESSSEDGADVTFADLLSAWENGDAEVIEKAVKASNSDDPKATEFNTIFWNTRNNHMYEKAKEFLADPEGRTYFIVVGAGHMEGDTGIVTQLARDGYDVERILH